MGLRSLFRKRQLATATGTVISPRRPEPQSPPPSEHLADLQDAWAELAEAAKGSGVSSFHACAEAAGPGRKTLQPGAIRIL